MWIVADVTFDTDPEGQEAERLAREGKLAGISADIGDVTATIEVLEVDEFGDPTDWLETLTAGEVLGATQLAMPAFKDAHIRLENGAFVAYLVPEGVVTSDRRTIELGALSWRDPAPLMFQDQTSPGHDGAVFVGNLSNFRRVDSLPDEEGMVAAGSWTPPAEWFTMPETDQPTPLTITDEGQVYGHVALFNECHIGLDGCVTAPTSHTGYRTFHTGTIRTAEGTDVPVGALTVGTGHAGLELGAQRTAEHYDHTGHAVADVHASDGSLGVWVCGAVRPTASEDQIETLRRSAISGDWRNINGHLELVAALAVNVPGFPIARVASGQQTALVAAAGPRREPAERRRAVRLAAARINARRIAS